MTQSEFEAAVLSRADRQRAAIRASEVLTHAPYWWYQAYRGRIKWATAISRCIKEIEEIGLRRLDEEEKAMWCKASNPRLRKRNLT